MYSLAYSHIRPIHLACSIFVNLDALLGVSPAISGCPGNCQTAGTNQQRRIPSKVPFCFSFICWIVQACLHGHHWLLHFEWVGSAFFLMQYTTIHGICIVMCCNMGVLHITVMVLGTV